MKLIEPDKNYVVAYYNHDEPLTATRKEVDILSMTEKQVIPFQVTPDGQLKRLDTDEDFIGIFEDVKISPIVIDPDWAFTKKIANHIEQFLWNE